MTVVPAREAVVLFDWNGTIVLDADRARAALNEVLARRGIAKLSRGRFADEFHLPMASMFVRLGVAVPADAEAEWNRGMASRPTTARPGIPALKNLRDAGVRMGIISAASDKSVGVDIERLELHDIWESIDAPAGDKLEALRRRRGHEAEAFYVGDTAYDMRCAREAGYEPVGVSGGYSHVDVLRKAGAAHIINGLDELPAIVAPHLELLDQT